MFTAWLVFLGVLLGAVAVVIAVSWNLGYEACRRDQGRELRRQEERELRQRPQMLFDQAKPRRRRRYSMNKINALLLAVIASALIVATAYGGIATTTSTTPQGGEGVQFDRQGGVVPDYNHFEGVTPLTITRVAIVGTYADGHQVTIFTGNFYNGSPELRLTNLTLTMTDQGHGFQPRRR